MSASPVTVADAHQLEASALDAAWARVLHDLPAMALLGPSGGRTREALAFAIEEAANNGVTDIAEMTEFALRALPGFRKPTKLRQRI